MRVVCLYDLFIRFVYTLVACWRLVAAVGVFGFLDYLSLRWGLLKIMNDAKHATTARFKNLLLL
jgi:hypothetical protein